MKRHTKLNWLVLILLIVFIAANINGINSLLSGTTDKTIDFGHSTSIVPQTWNTTKELNQANMSKTPDAITNEYIYIDHWDDWPEDHITSISEAKFKSMEDGGYKVLKNENTTLSGIPVSKQYFSNPTRENGQISNYIGVNYVFPKEDTNYTIQVHYFTTHDYDNATFTKEIDDCIENDMSNIHNNNYNGFMSVTNHIFETVSGQV
ncbi:hypothetical protein [Methanobrevibacter sp.]